MVEIKGNYRDIGFSLAYWPVFVERISPATTPLSPVETADKAAREGLEGSYVLARKATLRVDTNVLGDVRQEERLMGRLSDMMKEAEGQIRLYDSEMLRLFSREEPFSTKIGKDAKMRDEQFLFGDVFYTSWAYGPIRGIVNVTDYVEHKKS